MPLSPAVDRELIHTRKIQCRGYRRSDGLWDIEGHLTDTKTYPFENRDRGSIPAGEPVHEMWLRLTIDEDLLIHNAEAVTDYAPFSICPDITPNFADLRGLRIGSGWRRQIQARVGGVLGCTHLVELLGPMGTTAFQTLVNQRRQPQNTAATGSRSPGGLNTCHALKSDSVVVRTHWPEHYTGDAN